ncbi:hypothetical protein ACP6PL_24470 [Dapis sp. BLCC M126]|uniref:hypothetical protein n=1 Tax=Dapis sp. BLCC M126 TaxID=3400189 RepID=UPI003CF26FFF
MWLNDEGVKKVPNRVKIQGDTINFGQLPTVGTAPELIPQFYIGAVKSPKLQDQT